MIKLKPEEWDILADWIKDNTCGCIHSSFTGLSLKSYIDEYRMTEEQKLKHDITVLESKLSELRAKAKGVKL